MTQVHEANTPIPDPQAKRAAAPGLVDVHCHWALFDHPPDRVAEELHALALSGHAIVAVFVLASLGLPPTKIPSLVPRAFRHNQGLAGGRCRLEDLVSWREFAAVAHPWPESFALLPFLDVRAWDGKEDIRPLIAAGGFAGLKNILLLEEDEAKMGVEPLRHVRGFTREEYLECHRRTFALAEELDLPLVYHADLNHHAGFVRSCLEEHPRLRIDIPHFGFSRRLISGFFPDFPLLWSDISSLCDFAHEQPESYRRFIRAHVSRVLLGSDSIAAWGFAASAAHAQLVRDLELGPEMERAVLSENGRRFLGR